MAHIRKKIKDGRTYYYLVEKIKGNQLGRRNISKWDRTRLALKKEYILRPIANANKGLGRIKQNSAQFNVRDEVATS